MKSFPIGWLQSPHRLLARIMMQNLWPLSHNSNLTLHRARFLYAIITRVPLCMCKHIVMTMIEMQEDNQVALPYGGLVTRIIKRFVSDIPAYELEATPEGAFGKHTVIKSNAQLQRHMDPEEQVHPALPVQPLLLHRRPAPPSDAVMRALDWITDRLQSMDSWWNEQFQTMDIRLTEHFRLVDERFQVVLEAKVEHVNINVEGSVRYLAPKDQEN
jgi:hypothetical protein